MDEWIDEGTLRVSPTIQQLNNPTIQFHWLLWIDG